jgi:hypothetical protein
VSTPPSDLPGPPPAPPPPPPGPQTQIVGQQVAPSGVVPAGPPGPAAAGAHTNTLAWVSLGTGIGSFFAHIVPGIGGFTVALVAVITGYLARKQIRQSGEQGMGIATAGMIIGIVHLVLILLVVIGLIFLVFVFGIALFSAHPSG